MIKRNSILKTLEDNQDKIRRFGVRKIGIFGSFARRSQTQKSDIDILVEFQRGQKSFDNYMELKELLQALLNRKIDLVTKEALKSRIKLSILKETQYAGL